MESQLRYKAVTQHNILEFNSELVFIVSPTLYGNICTFGEPEYVIEIQLESLVGNAVSIVDT